MGEIVLEGAVRSSVGVWNYVGIFTSKSSVGLACACSPPASFVKRG